MGYLYLYVCSTMHVHVYKAVRRAGPHATATSDSFLTLQVHEGHREGSSAGATPGEVQDATGYAPQAPGARAHAVRPRARASQARPQRQQGQAPVRRLLRLRRGRGSHDVSPSNARRLYILCWRQYSRRKLSPTLATSTTLALTTLVAQCELSRRKIGLLLEVVGRKLSHSPGNPVTVGVVRWPAAGDTAGSRLRRLSSLQHRIYNLLGRMRYILFILFFIYLI